MKDNLALLPTVLLPWYEVHRRRLPWREQVSAYRTWVSEIMLQQTRVAAVIPYFTRFMETLPTVYDLAAADEETLLRLWQGLGYYSRVRNLQKAARTVVAEHNGRIPDEYHALRRLSGIGDYTAGAILSIAYGQCVPAVDGNVLRVLSRVTGYRGNVLEAQSRAYLRDRLAAVLPQGRAGDFHQALMDLGASVCLPNGAPLCADCPAQMLCTACRDGLQGTLPLRVKKTQKRVQALSVFVLRRDDGKTALRKRAGAGLLAGMWEFPHTLGQLDEQQAQDYLTQRGIHITDWCECLAARHEFTHLRWDMRIYVLGVRGTGEDDWLWCDNDTLEQKAVPSAFARCMAACQTAREQKKQEKHNGTTVF